MSTLDELRAAATPRPWTFDLKTDGYDEVFGPTVEYGGSSVLATNYHGAHPETDAAFITALVNADADGSLAHQAVEAAIERGEVVRLGEAHQHYQFPADAALPVIAEKVYQAFHHSKADVSFHVVSRRSSDPGNVVYLEADEARFLITVTRAMTPKEPTDG